MLESKSSSLMMIVACFNIHLSFCCLQFFVFSGDVIFFCKCACRWHWWMNALCPAGDVKRKSPPRESESGCGLWRSFISRDQWHFTMFQLQHGGQRGILLHTLVHTLQQHVQPRSEHENQPRVFCEESWSGCRSD